MVANPLSVTGTTCFHSPPLRVVRPSRRIAAGEAWTCQLLAADRLAYDALAGFPLGGARGAALVLGRVFPPRQGAPATPAWGIWNRVATRFVLQQRTDRSGRSLAAINPAPLPVTRGARSQLASPSPLVGEGFRGRGENCRGETQTCSNPTSNCYAFPGVVGGGRVKVTGWELNAAYRAGNAVPADVRVESGQCSSIAPRNSTRRDCRPESRSPIARWHRSLPDRWG